MALHRRRVLRAAAATTLASVAGCTSAVFGDGDDESRTYGLDVERISASPVEHALYEPSDDELFGDPARTALDAVLPEGRHTTHGYRPVSADLYVEHGGTYYQTESVVTGRERMERTLVRAEPIDREAASDDAIPVDSLERPAARVVKMLHSNAQTGGEGGSAELLRGDAYVLRRPAERESALAAGEFDGRIVTMKTDGPWLYRIRTTRTEIVETSYTLVAVAVADSRAAFREVVFGSRIDAELDPADLSSEVRETLETAVGRGGYEETTPLSKSYDALLDRLGLGGVDEFANGRLLWYDGELYRYALYVDDAES